MRTGLLTTDSTPGRALQALIGAGLFALGFSVLVGWGVAQLFDWAAGIGATGVALGALVYWDSRRS